MKSIGVRELRQHASEYLRMVKAGETIEVTERGEPVALMVPIGPETGIARLRKLGRITEAIGDPLALPPLPHVPGEPLPSEVLEAMRADER